MSAKSPFGDHNEKGTHLIMCKDGRSQIQETTIDFVRDDLGVEPFLTCFWGGALEVVKLGAVGIREKVFGQAPSIIGDPKRFILVNHLDCAGMSCSFNGLEPFSRKEADTHKDIMEKAAKELKIAFPDSKVECYILRQLDDFLKVLEIDEKGNIDRHEEDIVHEVIHHHAIKH